jgi:Ribbon-helix-helix protein, copG family
VSRPPGPGGVRPHVVTVRLTEDELARLQLRAYRLRKTVSELVRERLFDRPEDGPEAQWAEAT